MKVNEELDCQASKKKKVDKCDKKMCEMTNSLKKNILYKRQSLLS